MRAAVIAIGLIAQTIGAAGTIIVGSVTACSSSGCFHRQVNDLRFHIVHAVTFTLICVYLADVQRSYTRNIIRSTR
jgi:hypothetical protein